MKNCFAWIIIGFLAIFSPVSVSAVTFTVTNTLDTGPGSLRQAIQSAASSPGTNTIAFNILGAGVHTIVVTSELPTVPSQTLIDGYTQPGSRTNSLAAGDDAILLIELRPGVASFFNGLILNPNCTVRGLVINGFNYSGIQANGNATIEGNFIGTDPSGTVALGNDYYGIGMTTSGGNLRVGGAAPSARNIISASHYAGIYLNGSANNTNIIQGNYIGTDVTGARPLGNIQFGIENALTYVGAPTTMIGGTNAGEGNIIAFNGTGIWLIDGQKCAILENSIFGNLGPGIDLGYDTNATTTKPDGSTPNDPGDGDTGANGLQNFPIITSINTNGGHTQIQGTLNSTPSAGFRIELFANDQPSNSKLGQGQRFIGATNVTTDALGNVSFSVSVPGAYPFIGATDTDANGNTSEFSPATLLTGSDARAGDLFVGLYSGVAQWRRADGTLVQILDPGFTPPDSLSLGGMGFDASGNAYLTGGDSNLVQRFSPTGQLLGPFVLGNIEGVYSAGIDFDASQAVYVSSAYDTNLLRKFSPGGAQVDAFNFGNSFNGIYWAKIGSDQRTLYFDGYIILILYGPYYYPTIFRYDLVTRQFLSPLYLGAQDGSEQFYTFQLLPDGGALVATAAEIRRVNASGQVVQVYDAPGEDAWDPIALDADGRSFWAAGSSTPYVYRFDLATGNLLERINAGAPGGISSLAVRGGPSAGNAGLFLGMTADSSTVVPGHSITYTLTLLNFRTNVATGVTVTNTLPAGLTFNSATTTLGAFAQSSGKVTFNLGTVPQGATVTMTVTATPSAAGSFTNLAVANSVEVDPSPWNNSASWVTSVQSGTGCSLVVTATNDSGAGSLRAAITCANATPGRDTITFAIPGAGSHVIQPLSPLPAITDSVIIDGYSQSGAVANSSATVDNAVINVELNGTNAGSLAEGLVINASQSVVRGLAINNFSGDGIVLAIQGSNVVSGNFIGLDASGSVLRPNGKNGILIADSVGNRIGGTTASDRNLISGNNAAGIAMVGRTSGSNYVQGNFIGLDRNKNLRGNVLSGVLLSASDNVIGGTNSSSANVIAGNGHAGVEVFGSTYTNRYSISTVYDIHGVTILGNSIYTNTGPGIDLTPAGVTLNSASGQMNIGPNAAVNFPVISPVTPGSVSLGGTLSSIPSSSYRIELFVNAAPNASGYGEGQTLIATASLTTDTNGNGSFSASVSPLSDGQYLTATATELQSGNTSEFSRAVRVSPAADLALNVAVSSDPAQAKQNEVYTVTVTNKGPGSASGVVLIATMPGPATFISADSGATNNSARIGWTLGLLPPNTSTNVHFTVKPQFAGALSTTVTVTGIELDPATTDNSMTLQTTVSGTPRTLIVTTTNDSGAGSLRAVITDVNANGTGLDTITFNIPGSGVQTITLSSLLPSISAPVIIDGYTQPGAHANSLAQGNNALPLIEIKGNNSSISGLRLTTGNSTIRGMIIDRFAQYGISVYLYNSPYSNNVALEGNFIGFLPSGTNTATNGSYGMQIEYTGSVRVGGTNPAQRNVIAGAGTQYPTQLSAGIEVNTAGPITIQNNYIGTDVSGQFPLPNADNGILIQGGNGLVLIGGTNANEGNLIAYNNGIGVEVTTGTNTAILGNSVFGNTGKGIHLGSDSGPLVPPTPNDPGDVDSGPNDLQNYPVLTSVTTGGGTTAIQGSLNSLPNTQYRLEFFSNAKPHPSFAGDGQTFLGAKNVTTDANGNVNFTATFNGIGSYVSATATDPWNNTSEFSATFLPPAGTFQTGDIFVGLSSGQVQWRRHDGTPAKLLTNGVGGSAYALAFDPSGRLFAVEGDTNFISVFDNQGQPAGTVASNVVYHPQSISFDGSGNFYVCSSATYSTNTALIWKLGPTGNLLDLLNVSGQYNAARWADLAADQHTIYYTTFAPQVKRYDTASDAQLPDLAANLPSSYGYDLRVLPSGGALVSDAQSIVEYNAAGSIVRTYSVPDDYFSTLALDPDGKSFWAASQYYGLIYHFNFGNTNYIGSLPVFTANSSPGLTLFGEPRVAAPSAPVLSISYKPGNVVLSWPDSFAGYTLQRQTTLKSSWTDIASPSNQVSLPVTSSTQFFRLIKH